MSVVYRAADERIENKVWAVKEFRKDKNDTEREIALKALLQEANIMKRLDHPTLPRIVDIIDQRDTLYVVMDYIEGQSLNKVLDQYGAQPQEAVIEWAKQLSAVLDYLHTQTPPVIYRDMKPANIMLKPDGSIRLIDFGIAREYKEDSGDTMAMGTRGYAAPEMFGEHPHSDARTDIYSLGVTLYHLVTGKNPAEPPYEIYPIRHWDPTLNSGLEYLIQKCTQLNPADRFQSCTEVTYVLENLDKFVYEYKRQLRKKINLFTVTLILTVLLGAASAGCFLASRSMGENNYQSYITADTIEGYSAALELDEERPEAYLGLAKKLRAVDTIHPGTADKFPNLPATEVTTGQIATWFSAQRLQRLEETDVNTYVQVNYCLGRMFWNSSSSGSDVIDNATAFTEANKYFANVIRAAGPDRSGLSEAQYNLARVYYLASYFQLNKARMDNLDDGDFEVSEAAVKAGVYGAQNGTLSNPYYSYWKTCRELLRFLDGDNDVTDQVKLNAMRRLAYILGDNYRAFHSNTRNKPDKVDEEEIRGMYSDFSLALRHLDSSGVDSSELRDIKNSLNLTAKYIEGLYNMELEEIK